jgi:hypothetical protein
LRNADVEMPVHVTTPPHPHLCHEFLCVLKLHELIASMTTDVHLQTCVCAWVCMGCREEELIMWVVFAEEQARAHIRVVTATDCCTPWTRSHALSRQHTYLYWICEASDEHTAGLTRTLLSLSDSMRLGRGTAGSCRPVCVWGGGGSAQAQQPQCYERVAAKIGRGRRQPGTKPI